MKKFINKKNTAFLILLVVAVTFVLFGNNVLAQDGGGVGTTWAHWLVGGIARAIVSVLGWILAKLMGILIYVAQYDNFTNATAIKKGWIIARDIANMFFVVILLVIAFATILRVEKYNYKKWLPKLILMAILINFSKTISGLLIDVSQVIMLSFVNAFSAIGAGKLTDMLGIKDWQSLKGVEDINNWEIAAAYVLAVFYSIIALVTVAAMVGILVMRIIMIWVYVVLSPFAFLLMSFPDGASYASRWWSEFTKNLIVGPVLAFFIWLSFAALGTTTTEGYQVLGEFDQSDTAGAEDFDMAKCNRDENGMCEYGTSDLMIQFIISIAMLIGGMKIAQEIGGAGGGIAGSAMGKVKGMGRGMSRGMSKWGAGALGAVSGYSFAKRRYSNWRQGMNKNLQQKSDLAYERIKGGTKGFVAGATTSAVRGIGGLMPKNAAKIASKKHSKLVDQKKRQETKRHKEALYDAYGSGVYEDSSGKKYKWDDKKKQYVNEEDKSVATYRDKNGNKKDVKKMNDFMAGYKQQYRSKTTKARALQNQIREEKMTEKQKVFTQAGTSTTDLKRVLNDGSNSSSKRMAAALELAVKEGFKNSDIKAGRQEVAKAKSVFGNNEPMLKKFNESINKRFASLNFDLDSDGGKNEYKAAIADGRVEGYKQDSSTLDKEMIKTLRDYSGKDFGKNIGTMMSLSKDHREKGMGAIRDAKMDELKDGKPLYNSSTDELIPYAKLLAKNGDIEGAFNNSTDSKTLNFDNQSVNAFKKFLETASATDLGKINNDYLDETKLAKLINDKGMTASAPEIKNMKLRIEKSIVQDVDVQKIASVEYKDDNPEFVRRYVGSVNKYGSSDKQKQIKDNNILHNIKPIS